MIILKKTTSNSGERLQVFEYLSHMGQTKGETNLGRNKIVETVLDSWLANANDAQVTSRWPEQGGRLWDVEGNTRVFDQHLNFVPHKSSL